MKERVEIRIKAKKSDNGYIDYEATVEPFMENFIRVYGYTHGNVIQVEQALHRALRGDLLPASAEEVAIRVITSAVLLQQQQSRKGFRVYECRGARYDDLCKGVLPDPGDCISRQHHPRWWSAQC